MITMTRSGIISGVERIAAWKDLLNDINVFPVADGDTGVNLVTSLSPLRFLDEKPEDVIDRMLIAARGNSGNIASLFFSGFLETWPVEDYPAALEAGRERAYRAVSSPVPGTMLSFFDDLCRSFTEHRPDINQGAEGGVIADLVESVKSTTSRLPALQDAGVIDAGALGMFIFFETFLLALAGKEEGYVSIIDEFSEGLTLKSGYRAESENGFCVDLVLESGDDTSELEDKVNSLGESGIVIREKDRVKIHLHSDDLESVRRDMESLGTIVNWSVDDIDAQVRSFGRNQTGQVHILTDAAGSLTMNQSRSLGFTLLNSYLNIDDISKPETYFDPAELYRAMNRGIPVSTSQASTFERHHFYGSIYERFGYALYLSVGSVFTGNYQTALDWKEKNDRNDTFRVIDSTAASGRLAVYSLAVQRYASGNASLDEVEQYALDIRDHCSEYLFLNQLKFLAAGGRLSKGSAFFGDMLRMKPVISPLAEGAKKMDVVHTFEQQLDYALERISGELSPESRPLVLLEYSDNRETVEGLIYDKVARLLPRGEIMTGPLSLTSGAHMGPGTWGIAWVPGEWLPEAYRGRK
jgi:hypothetical protein